MDEATGQLMAVKMMAIPTSSAPLGAARTGKAGPESELRALCSEIELMRSFEHPNIVRYLGAAVDEAQLQLSGRRADITDARRGVTRSSARAEAWPSR